MELNVCVIECRSLAFQKFSLQLFPIWYICCFVFHYFVIDLSTKLDWIKKYIWSCQVSMTVSKVTPFHVDFFFLIFTKNFFSFFFWIVNQSKQTVVGAPRRVHSGLLFDGIRN